MDHYMEGGGVKVNVLAKFPRIARLYKLIKFHRLAKLTKVLQKRMRIPKTLSATLRIKEGKQRLQFFLLIVFISVHIFACIFLFISTMDEERNWLKLKLEGLESDGETDISRLG